MGFSFFNVEAGVRAEVLASGGHGAVPHELYKFRTAKGKKLSWKREMALTFCVTQCDPRVNGVARFCCEFFGWCPLRCRSSSGDVRVVVAVVGLCILPVWCVSNSHVRAMQVHKPRTHFSWGC